MCLLAWQFIANSYSHALISVLASYNRFNVVVQALFPRQGRNFTRKIVGGVVLDRDEVVKLKITNFFLPGVFVSGPRKFMLAQISCYTVYILEAIYTLDEAGDETSFCLIHAHSEMLDNYLYLRPEGKESIESDPSFHIGFHCETNELVIPGVVRTQAEQILQPG